MLNPLEESEEVNDDYIVCDIENTPDGAVIDIDTAWRDDGHIIRHHTVQTWRQWWDWIKPLARKDKKYRTIYAHNGGGWDWLSLVHELLTDFTGEKDSVSAVMAGSSMVVLQVRVSKHFTLRLCDSLQLLRSGLDSLSKQLLGKSKVDLDGKLPHEIKEDNEELYYEYLKTDTENLLHCLEASLDIIRENVAKISGFGVTIGSTAMKVFRTIGMDEPITIPWKDDLKSLLRKAYNGGRVECFRSGVYNRVWVYDINSLYPSIMLAKEVPTSDRGEWVSDYVPNKCGVFTGRFRQYRRDIPPVLIERGVGAYETEGSFFGPELDLLKEVDNDADFEVDSGFVFFDTSRVFNSYVSRLYQLRLDNPDTPLSLLCKFLLNSLYGKFGQHPLREKLIHVDDYDRLYDLVENGATVEVVHDELSVYKMVSETDCGFEHVGIAGMITSHARCSLYRGLLEAGNELVYCDTDSVHTTSPIGGDFIGPQIGRYKLEFQGEGVYAGKKLYALRSPDGTEKIRAKGVSTSGRNGCRLSFDDICRVCDGETIKAEFQRPATARQVFAGLKPCNFASKHRTIRKTATR